MSFLSKIKSISNTLLGRQILDIRNKVVQDLNLSKREREEFEQKLEILVDQEVNILLVGGTGVGKSSTINAIFKNDSNKSNDDFTEHACVGRGPDPETQQISSYRIGNLTIWDTPGLGESPKADLLHTRAIAKILEERKGADHYLIDFVLVIFDGAARDYASTFQLLNVIAPKIGDKKRFVVGINRIDLLVGGRGWDYNGNRPSPALQTKIEQKVKSVKERVFQSTGIDTDPVAYSAGFVDEFGGARPYNISQLLFAILDAVEPEKRVAVLQQTKEETLKATIKQQPERFRKSTEETLTRGGLGFLAKAGLAILTGGLGGLLGGCFITTAVAETLGKKDDCHMLYAFRKFRDCWLQKQPDGPSLIAEYYRIAPNIVWEIDSHTDRDDIYASIYNSYLKECYRLVKHSRYKECKTLYVKMVEDLKSQYLKREEA